MANSIEVAQEYRAKPSSVSCTENAQCFGEGAAHSTFIALLASAREWLTRRVKLQVVQTVFLQRYSMIESLPRSQAVSLSSSSGHAEIDS